MPPAMLISMIKLLTVRTMEMTKATMQIMMLANALDESWQLSSLDNNAMIIPKGDNPMESPGVNIHITDASDIPKAVDAMVRAGSGLVPVGIKILLSLETVGFHLYR